MYHGEHATDHVSSEFQKRESKTLLDVEQDAVAKLSHLK